MKIVVTLASAALIVLTLVDAFEGILQPRRVTHRFRYARVFYRLSWQAWRFPAVRIRSIRRREAFLSIFGPLSMLTLFVTWMIGLIIGFGLLHWSLGTRIATADGASSVLNYLYLSGTTFFTLGYGDITPTAPLGRVLAVIEAGLGFGFLAVVISYLPVLSQAFSSREVIISLLDARAGSPPSALEFLSRLGGHANLAAMEQTLAEWERWAAQLLESHLSFPVLSYYRSQHDNQSWLAALTTMLDCCSVLLAMCRREQSYQVQLTFAMARHAAVDLGLVLKTPPVAPPEDRLDSAGFHQLHEALTRAGWELHEGPAAESKLRQLRGAYEPFVHGLSGRFLFSLPPIVPPQAIADNWQRSAWMARIPGINALPLPEAGEKHFG